MRTRLEALEVRRRELRQELRELTDREKQGYNLSRTRMILSSKLAHVDKSILELKQLELPLQVKR